MTEAQKKSEVKEEENIQSLMQKFLNAVHVQDTSISHSLGLEDAVQYFTAMVKKVIEGK